MLQYGRPSSITDETNKKTASAELVKLVAKLEEQDVQEGVSDGCIVRIFERDASSNSPSYEVYGAMAVWIAEEILKQPALLIADPQSVFLPLTPSQLAMVLREVASTHRVEIWSFNAARKGWRRQIRASPGHWEALEGWLGEDGSANLERAGGAVIASVIVTKGSAMTTSGSNAIVPQTQVALAMVDMARLIVGWTSFPDGPRLTNLEAALMQINAKECIYPNRKSASSKEFQRESYPPNNATEDGIEKLLGEGGLSTVLGTPLSSIEFLPESLEEDLQKILIPSSIMAIPDNIEIKKALVGILRYLNLAAYDENLGVFHLERLHLEGYMRLDETALLALGVFPSPSSSQNSMDSNSSLVGPTALQSQKRTRTSFSLFTRLNECKTRGGSKLLAQWLRQPLTDRGVIEKRLDVVQLLVENSLIRQMLRDKLLRGIPDVGRLIKRLVRGRRGGSSSTATTGLVEMVHLAQVAERVALLHDTLLGLVNTDSEATSSQNLSSPLGAMTKSLNQLLLAPLRALAEKLALYQELVKSTVDEEAVARHEYLIRATFDPQLQVAQEQKERLLQAMDNEFDRVASRLGLEKGKKIKLEHNSTYGFILRISRLDSGALRKLGADEDDDGIGSSNGGSGCGIEEVAALKSGILFVTPTLKEFTSQYQELVRQYEQKQHALVEEMIKVAQTYRKPFELLGEVLARLDVFQALAYAAITAPLPYVRPHFQEDPEEGDLIFEELRHVCLEGASSTSSCSSYIANDIYMNRTTGTLQLITGPNMGGKSTFIRSVALAVLMAQIGSFVPASRATLPVMDALMVRVGAGDCLHRGLSTFMMEMVETAAIIQGATSRSLVIIDELGRGTSTAEGFGLAWAVARELVRKRCRSLFATHFHELADLALVQPGVKNLFVEALFQEDNTAMSKSTPLLVMTFKVKEGSCNQSYGIECARMAGFPEAVLRKARGLLAELEGREILEK